MIRTALLILPPATAGGITMSALREQRAPRANRSTGWRHAASIQTLPVEVHAFLECAKSRALLHLRECRVHGKVDSRALPRVHRPFHPLYGVWFVVHRGVDRGKIVH